MEPNSDRAVYRSRICSTWSGYQPLHLMKDKNNAQSVQLECVRQAGAANGAAPREVDCFLDFPEIEIYCAWLIRKPKAKVIEAQRAITSDCGARLRSLIGLRRHFNPEHGIQLPTEVADWLCRSQLVPLGMNASAY